MADEMWRLQALAPYATLPWASRGRLHREAEARTRSPFQRDRDRAPSVLERPARLIPGYMSADRATMAGADYDQIMAPAT